MIDGVLTWIPHLKKLGWAILLDDRSGHLKDSDGNIISFKTRKLAIQYIQELRQVTS